MLISSEAYSQIFRFRTIRRCIINLNEEKPTKNWSADKSTIVVQDMDNKLFKIYNTDVASFAWVKSESKQIALQDKEMITDSYVYDVIDDKGRRQKIQMDLMNLNKVDYSVIITLFYEDYLLVLLAKVITE
jgi:hypothetical protein